MKISVIGTGYVGLVSGACLADNGHQVVCVDINEATVERINRADPPIYEKGLEDLLKRNVPKNLSATSELEKAVLDSDLSLIAVGTPFDGKEIDLSYIVGAAQQIGAALKKKDGYHVVVVKSTVVPGTSDEVVLPALEQASGKRAGEDFGVGMNPEFLREGEAIDDFMYPDRIVMGGIDKRTQDVLREVYSPFPDADVLVTNNRTAEMIKYTANSLLATLISFSNEVGNLCAGLPDVDALEVMKGVHLDKRVSPILKDGTRIVPSLTTYLEAGCGFGGSCFPKDVNALIAFGQQRGASMSLLKSVMDINHEQPGRILALLRKRFDSLANVRLAILGLAFKPGTDDMRESPAIPVVKALQEEGAILRAFDPVAMHEAREIFGDKGIEYCNDLRDTIRDAEAIVILTRWPEFAGLPELIANADPAPLLVDGRRMLDKDSVNNYEGIGLQARG